MSQETDVMDTRQMLEAVNKAVFAIAVGGQSYKIGTRSLTRADLTQLYKIKSDLEARINAETQTPLLDDTYVVFFDGR